MPFSPISRPIILCHSMRLIPPHSIRHYRQRYATSSARFDAIQSGDNDPTIRNPASQSGQINITSDSDSDSERLHLAHGSSSAQHGLRDSKESLFLWRGRWHGGSPHTPQTRATPKSRYSSLSRETSYLAPIPVSILGCNHPLLFVLTIAVL